VEAKILAARWSSHVRSPENTAVWIMTPNPAMNRTHKQRRFACRLCAGYRKRYLPQKETDHVHALVLAGEAR